MNMREYTPTDSQLDVFLDIAAHEETLMYNLPFLLRFPADVDRDRVWTAFTESVAAHPVYSATFVSTDHGPVMRVPETVRAEEFKPTPKDRFMKPFDLEHGPLWRAALVDEGLMFEFHHLVFDGTTGASLVREIAARYNGLEPEREGLTIFDAIAEETAYKGSPEHAADLEWFRNRFGGIDAESGFPSDADAASAKAEGADRLADASCVLDAAGFCAEDLKTWAKSNGITVNTLMMSAFGYAAAVYAGSDETLFTMATHGRIDRRFFGAHGMFVRPMPIHVRVGETDCLTFMRTLQDDFREERRHGRVPFRELASEFGLSIRFNYNFTEELLPRIPLGDATGVLENLGDRLIPGDVMLMVFRNGDRYTLRLTYGKDIYRPETAETFLRFVKHVAERFVAGGRLSEIPLVTRESAAVLDAANGSDLAYDRTKTVVDLFREQAAAHPDKLALACLDRRYAYGELDRLTDAIAAEFAARGAGREKVVGVLVPRTEWITILSLGILKSGAAYLPLDASYPDDRLNLMLKDSGAIALVSTPELGGRITADFTGERILLDDLKSVSSSLVPHPSSLIPPAPDDLFLMLYTSGTTGLPKGALIEHRNVMAFTVQNIENFRIGANSVVAAYASYGFDANIMDTYSVLAAGGTLDILSEDIRLDLDAVRRRFNEMGVTHTMMTTQVGRQFAMTGGSDRLECLMVGGEKLVPLDPPKFRLYNGYGPSESVCYVTSYVLDRKVADVPIGKANRNVRLYVCDRYGRRLPPNAIGELWAAGQQVCRGYLNRPEKTAEAFVTNPFTDDPDYARVYRTGDVVRMRADGTVFFVGRRDAQVKVRGFRIELAEVEEVVRRFPGVKDATVAAFDNPAGGKFIAAYVVGDGKIDIGTMNAFIAAEKPPYMVPAVTMQIDRIPLNQNSKVNKRALPKPQLSASDRTGEEPKTEAEIRLCEAMASVLSLEKVYADDDFYSIGGDSISSMRVAAACGLKGLNASDIYRGHTPRDIAAAYFARVGESGASRDADALDEESRRVPHPLTAEQRYMVDYQFYTPISTMYNNSVLLACGRDGVDVERLAQAVTEAISNHPALESQISADKDGELLQSYRPGSFGTVRVEHLTEFEFRFVREGLVKPFKLLDSSLCRSRIFVTEKAVYLFLDIHHVFSDGMSLGVLFGDIGRAYAGQPLVRDYYYLTLRNREAEIGSPAYQRSREYFEREYGGTDWTFQPKTDHESRENAYGNLSGRMGISQSAADRATAHYGVSRNEFFLTAFGLAFAALERSKAVSFSWIYNGRDDRESQSTYGLLYYDLPVAYRFERGMTVGQMMAETKHRVREGIEHACYPFNPNTLEIVSGDTPCVLYQGDMGKVGIPGLGFSLVESGGRYAASQAVADFSIFDLEDDFMISLNYAASRYEQQTMERYVAAFQCACRLLAEDPGDTELQVEDALKMISGESSSD